MARRSASTGGRLDFARSSLRSPGATLPAAPAVRGRRTAWCRTAFAWLLADPTRARARLRRARDESAGGWALAVQHAGQDLQGDSRTVGLRAHT